MQIRVGEDICAGGYQKVAESEYLLEASSNVLQTESTIPKVRFGPTRRKKNLLVRPIMFHTNYDEFKWRMISKKMPKSLQSRVDQLLLKLHSTLRTRTREKFGSIATMVLRAVLYLT